MSKKIRSRIAAGLALVALFGVLLVVARVTAQQGAGAAVTTANTSSATVAAATVEVLDETSKLRELPILRPVRSGAQSRAEIEAMIVRNLNEETTPEELHASEVTLKKLGLVPADFQFRPFLIKLLTEQVAGYYDTKQQEFFLADWIPLDGQKPVMAHELTHALQDQHFNLRRFDKWPKGDSDAELAAHALVEGDATLVMMQYVMRDPKRALAFLSSGAADAGSSELIESAPRAIRESLLFPYEHGLQWVSKVYGRGNWKLVSQAYTDLPRSTEQILHPDKYFAHEAPMVVDIPDLNALLGPGWKRIDYDVNGEFGYYLILDEYLKSAPQSTEASSGWGGDRYAVYENAKSGGVIVVQRSKWDTPGDAQEFYDAYKQRTVRRYPGATDPNLLALRFGSGWHEGQGWRTSEGLAFVSRVGNEVVTVEGVPDSANIDGLIEKLAGVKVTKKRSKRA